MKKINITVLCTLVSSLFVVSPQGAYAKIAPMAFKGVTRCFKEGKEFFSPVVGMAALESGIIYNFRFYGNFEPAYRMEGTVQVRNYIQDKSIHPVWNVVKILFPSSGGQLTGESSFSTSFGKVVHNPQSMAVLLNFLNMLRSWNLP